MHYLEFNVYHIGAEPNQFFTHCNKIKHVTEETNSGPNMFDLEKTVGFLQSCIGA